MSDEQAQAAAPAAEPTSILGSNGQSNNTSAQPQGEPAGQVAPQQADQAQAIQFPENWKEALPEDILNDPSLKAIKDIQSLAKSYVHAQKSLGAEKLLVPNKYEEFGSNQWQDVFKKLGLPDSIDGYDITPKEGQEVDEDFQKAFKETCLKAGILPQQALALSEWYDSRAAEINEKLKIENATYTNQELGKLKQEWGEKFQSNIELARNAVEEIGGPDFQKFLEDSQLDNNVQLIKIFAKVGEALGEDKFRSDNTSTTGLMTPAEAAAKIAAIHGDKNHPYWDKKHPEHKHALAEMTRLHEAKLSRNA